jgi:hypothetical protein
MSSKPNNYRSWTCPGGHIGEIPWVNFEHPWSGGQFERAVHDCDPAVIYPIPSDIEGLTSNKDIYCRDCRQWYMHPRLKFNGLDLVLENV